MRTFQQNTTFPVPIYMMMWYRKLTWLCIELVKSFGNFCCKYCNILNLLVFESGNLQLVLSKQNSLCFCKISKLAKAKVLVFFCCHFPSEVRS